MTTDLSREADLPQPTHAMGKERDKLRTSLRRIDLVFFTLAALIAIDTIAVTAAVGGGQTLVWLLVLIVVYLVPYGMIVSELGSAFPYEGGPYVWPRLAFGRLAGAYTATFYWMSNPVWVGSTVAAVVVAAVNSLIVPGHPIGTWASIAVGLGVVCACTVLSWIERRRQVGRSYRRGRPAPDPGHLPGAGRRVPGEERQAGGHRHRRRPQAQHRGLPCRHRPVAVPVRRLRTLERRGRRDEQSPRRTSPR